MWKNDTLTTAGCPAGCPRLRNHWGEQRLAPLRTDSLGRFSWGPEPWSADPSGKHCFNISGRVSGLGKSSWYEGRISRYNYPVIKIRRLRSLLILIMGIHVLVKWHLYIETTRGVNTVASQSIGSQILTIPLATYPQPQYIVQRIHKGHGFHLRKIATSTGY